MNVDDVCTLCGNPIGDSEVCVLGKTQLSTFIKKSKKREDTLWKFWEGKESVQVHSACRERYSARLPQTSVKKRNLNEEETVESPVPSSSQCSVLQLPTNSEFDFKNKCFFCNKPLDSKHKKVIKVQNAYLRYKLLEIAEKRNDDCEREMIQRLMSINCLVKSEASYHKLCYVRFVSSVQTAPKISATKQRLEEAFNNVTNFIETSHTYRFGMNELREKMGDDYMTNEIFFKRLKEKYGDDIYIDRHRGRETKVYYKQFEIPKICSDWFCDNNLVNEQQKFIIINIAAEMIRTEILEMNLENQSYSPPTKFLDCVSTSIPPLLQKFLSKLVYSDKCEEEYHNPVKLDTIAHSIISMIRPKSFISNLQLAIATYVHRKTGSKIIIDLLSKLGICATYYNLQLFEASTIKDLPEMIVDDDTFVQFVFDNTDHNVGTLDGQETFHCLGGIAAYCPKENISYQGGSKKLKKMPTANEIALQKQIEIVPYQNPDRTGMKDIIFVSTASLDLGDAPSLSLPYGTYLWSKYFEIPQIPSWRGFMEVLTNDEILSSNTRMKESLIVCVPFINSPPSNLTTLNTSLHYAVSETNKLQQKTTFITYDQPLYSKARSIVASLAQTTLKNVVVLLGIFHLLMSYLGAIGYTMEGSGIEELWSVIYAPESVKKMLSGHAFARALRAHILTFTALGIKICSTIDGSPEWKEHIVTLMDEWPTVTRGDCRTEKIIEMTKAFMNQLDILESNGPTTKLWIQYFKCVLTALRIVEAERLGDWKLHLLSVRDALPLFHAAGHYAYAKTAQIYLQDMTNLELIMDPVEFDEFTKGGFTIRRSDKAWAGVSRDMVIEQTLNRFFGTDLKHGRGVTPSVVTRYLLAMPAAFLIMEKLENYCNIETSNSEQHVDLAGSRISRDKEDIQKLLFWLNAHDPFYPRSSVVSLSTGVFGGSEINCHMAIEKGQQAMAKMIGKNAEDISLSRLYRVKNLSNAGTEVHLNDGKPYVNIDSYLLFQRISVGIGNNTKALKKAMKYELAPSPLSLFDEKGWMRKNRKSDLYTLFKATIQSQFILDKCTFVVDGGWLLRQVVWSRGKTYNEIFGLYLSYIIKFFREDVVVIFDGYREDIIGVKSYERLRRKEQCMAADVEIALDKLIITTQAKFLANIANKFKFVQLLSAYLIANSIQTVIANEDADSMIVNKAIDIQNRKRSTDPPVVVVGNDVDLLLLLIGLTPEDNTIYFYKITSTGKKNKVLYSTRYYKELKPFILFAHAFAGCDSTSAIYNKGKKMIIELLQSNEKLRDSIKIFYKKDSNVDELYVVAERIMGNLYAKNEWNELPIDELRYRIFSASLAKTKKQILASLPPSRSALTEHVKRVYYQIQQWLGVSLDAEQWGWKRNNQFMIPIKSELEPAPKDLLKLISCRCTKSKCEKNLCLCRKAGVHCTYMCANCVDEGTCINKPIITETIEEINDANVHLESEPEEANDIPDDDGEEVGFNDYYEEKDIDFHYY